MTDLIIAIDDKLSDEAAQKLNAGQKRGRLRALLDKTCSDFCELQVPGTGRRVQLKLNTILRALGHECLETVESAGLDVFADYKIGADVLDTMFADMRALMDHKCIKRLTFRIECPVEFLAGRGEDAGARALMPHCAFLPVGPVTDLADSYYTERMQLDGGRAEAMHLFSIDIARFGALIEEVICSPKDIGFIEDRFWDTHNPVTPAVRPVGLGGNKANDVNAFNVKKAIQTGSKGLIIGSPIMGAENRREAAELVLRQMEAAMAT